MYVFVVFIDLERHKPFAYIPKVGSKSCSSPQNFRLASWIDFKSLKKCFGEDKKPKGVEE